MRVHMSARGSDILIVLRLPSAWVSALSIRLPGGLLHTRQLALIGEQPETDTAHAKLAHEAAGPPARPVAPHHLATIAMPPRVLRYSVGLHDLRHLRHRTCSRSLLRERHAEKLEQPLTFFVRVRGRDDVDLHPAHTLDLVERDFREDDLLR